MGDILPATPKRSERGLSAVKVFLLAVLYLILVPAVCAVSLMVAAAYFPGPTKALLGPAFRNLDLTEQTSDGTSLDQGVTDVSQRVAAMDERLSKVETDLLALSQQASAAAPTAVGGEQAQSEVSQVSQALEKSRDRDKVLIALAAVSVSRTELLAGNWEVAARELGIAWQALEGTNDAGSPEALSEVKDALLKASEALASRGVSAADRLSLVWHLLVEAASEYVTNP